MFTDIAKITLKAGDGGNGAVTFHREKYVNAGGPDGGDGGRGGNIVLVADNNLSTLADFRYKRKYTAQNGENGFKKRSSGKSGGDLVIKVPTGTLVRDAQSGRVLADISGAEPVILAKGGRGGWGNAHFATPTRQIPRFSKPGTPGEFIEAVLELKLLADVGLLGFPNVGKSTLISVVSEAKPVIANYHFTTLSPVLGVVRASDTQSFVMADIPGLIEGASEGAGLGHEFLRHVDRCRLLVHIVDVSGIEGRSPGDDFNAINLELQKYSAELAKRPQIVAANKCDIAKEEDIAKFKKTIQDLGLPFFAISAATGDGTRELIYEIAKRLKELPPIKQYEREEPSFDERAQKAGNEFNIRHEDGVFMIEADWLGYVLGSVNMDDYESLQYFQRVLRNSGIIAKLEEMGVREGDTVCVLDYEFEYVS